VHRHLPRCFAASVTALRRETAMSTGTRKSSPTCPCYCCSRFATNRINEAEDIRFRIDSDSISFVVQALQPYQLLANDTDAVAEAFQVVRGKAFKGDEGQYFTPPSVVNVAIAALDPRPEDRVIDPACGSGSFLAAALGNVVGQLDNLYGGDPSARNLARRDWSTQNLYALDKDSVSVRLSKAYLSMLGDGSTHVYKSDSIRPSEWPRTIAANVRDGSFDVVVTNPPFGTKLKVDASVGRDENFDLCRVWKQDENGEWDKTGEFETRELGLVFLESNICLLRAGGKLAIVLPDTYLFSDSYAWLVKWLSRYTITHSINVPIEAFEPHCRAKTSILVLRNEAPSPGHQIIGSVCETFGEDKHGRLRFTFAGGQWTDQVDDEMEQAASLFLRRTRDESKLHFRFSQREAVSRGILVASYWWRSPYLASLQAFAEAEDCELVSVGDLVDTGAIEVFSGHGSPSSHNHGQGPVPYIKVTDIKNWRIIENPKYMIPESVANGLRKRRQISAFDLVTPTRASKNIGLFGVVMPWQRSVVLTREIAVWRFTDDASPLDRWLFLALASMRIVHDQFRYLVLMQTNREDLGRRWRELLLPIPRDAAKRTAWATPIREYFQAVTAARESYDNLAQTLEPSLFIDRP